MNSLLRERLGDPSSKSEEDLRQHFREAVQEIALYSLSAHGFFKKAIFHGGTELRIVHSLPRFSEDLDFLGGKEKAAVEGWSEAMFLHYIGRLSGAED